MLNKTDKEYITECNTLIATTNHPNVELINKTGIEAVDNVNLQICYFISSFKKFDSYKFSITCQYGDIESKIIDTIPIRRMLFFFIIQKSSKGMRYLVYMHGVHLENSSSEVKDLTEVSFIKEKFLASINNSKYSHLLTKYPFETNFGI